MQVSKKAARQLMIERERTVDDLCCLQIDTINIVEGAHHLTIWARMGQYDKEHLHELAYQKRRLFEHFAHAICYIPFKDCACTGRPLIDSSARAGRDRLNSY